MLRNDKMATINRKAQRAAKAARTFAPTFEMSLDNITFSDAVALMPVELKVVDYEVTENVKVSGGRKSGGRKAHARSNSLKNKERYGKTNPTRKERKEHRLAIEKKRYTNPLDSKKYRAAKMALKVAEAYADYNKPSRVTLDEDEEITISTVDNRSTRERIAEISAKAVEIQKRIDALRKRYNC